MVALLRNVVTMALVAAILLTIGMPDWRIEFRQGLLTAKRKAIYVTTLIPDVLEWVREPLEGKR
jgi:hypothetical protein